MMDLAVCGVSISKLSVHRRLGMYLCLRERERYI